jgi:drug/metabolite transporter (DMT)-like permease
MTGAAIFLAVIAALFVAVGSALQHQGVGDADAPEQGGIALVIRLLKNKPWMAGLIITGLSTLLHAAALKDGTLAVVETVMAINLAMALPVRAWLERAKPSAAQTLAALVLTVGVAVFIVAANPTDGDMTPNGGGAFLILAVGIIFALVCIAIASRTQKERVAGVTLGLAGGVLYGLAGGVLKTVVAQLLTNPVGALFSWPLWVLIGLNAWAFVLHQEAYARAPLRASLPALSVSNPIAGIIFGGFVFDEIPAHSLLAVFGELVGLAIIGGSILALAQRDPGRHRRQPSFFGARPARPVPSAVSSRRGAAQGSRRRRAPGSRRLVPNMPNVSAVQSVASAQGAALQVRRAAGGPGVPGAPGGPRPNNAPNAPENGHGIADSVRRRAAQWQQHQQPAAKLPYRQ